MATTFGSTSETSTEMRKYTRDLYARLEAETGLDDRLQARRLHRGRRRARPPRGVPPRLGVQPPLRRRRARDLAGAGEGALPARAGRRHPRRLLREGRRPGESGRHHDGAREGRADAGRDDPRGRRGHQRHARLGGHRASPASTRRTATSRPNTSSTAPACGRGSSARSPGVNIPLQSAEHYYLITDKIPGHRRLARARGSGVVRLLPRGGRRPHGRPLRAGLRAVEGRGRSGRLLVRRDHARLGSHGTVRREGDARASRRRSRSA